MNTEEVELLSDSKYRNYVAAVDKALKNFEYSSEWADLISALGKLNKVNLILCNCVSSSCSYPFIKVLWSIFVGIGFQGIAEQCKVPGGSQEADDWETSGPMPAPGPAQRGPPQGPGDLRDNLQDHRTQEAGQRSLSLQVLSPLIPASNYTLNTRVLRSISP